MLNFNNSLLTWFSDNILYMLTKLLYNIEDPIFGNIILIYDYM